MGNRTKMEIKFYCVDAYQDDIPEPVAACEDMPQWFKQTDNITKSKCPFAFLPDMDVKAKVNIKNCPAVFDYLSTGYVIRAWDNFVIRNIDGSLYINWEKPFLGAASDDAIFSTHYTRDQMSGLCGEDEPLYGGLHKLLSPWFVKTPPGVSLYITNPSQYRDKRFTSVDGVIHPEEKPITLQWFFEWNKELPMNVREEDFDIKTQVIKKGTPLMVVIPFKRDKYTSKVEYLAPDDIFKDCQQATVRYTHDWFGNSLYNQFRRKIGRLFT